MFLRQDNCPSFEVENGTIKLAPNLLDEKGRKTGLWVEFGEKADDSDNELAERLMTVRDASKDEEFKGEGTSPMPILYYEKGRYNEGKRIGTWRRLYLHRRVDEIYEYNENGDKSGNYLMFDPDATNSMPEKLSYGAYKEGKKEGFEFYSLSKIPGSEVDIFKGVWTPSLTTNTRGEKCVLISIKDDLYYSTLLNKYNKGEVVAEGGPEIFEEKDKYTGQFDPEGNKEGLWKDSTGEGVYHKGLKEGKWLCTLNDYNRKVSFHRNYGGRDDFVTFEKGVLHGPFKQGHQRGEYKFDLLEGYFEEKYKIGVYSNLVSGYYSRGVKTGKWFTDTIEGDFPLDFKGECFKTYKEGKIDGEACLISDTYKSEGFLLDDKKVGKWEYYDVKSKRPRLLKEGEYLDGKKTGVWTFYYDKDKVVGQYENDNPVGEWSHTGYKHKILCLPGAKFDTRYHSRWFIPEYCPYLLDVSHNNLLKCRKEGTLLCELDEKGKVHGKFTYEESGYPVTEGTFEHGKMTGPITVYVYGSKPPVKIIEGFFSDGMREGQWKFYNIGGRLSVTGEYSKGKKVGDWINVEEKFKYVL